MNNTVRISHPEILLFSRWTAQGQVEESSGRILSWKSEELETPTLVSCIAGFESERSFNSIHLSSHPEFADFFPDTFRFEISHDGQVWEPILQESSFRSTMTGHASWNFPLITARYVKFLFFVDRTLKNGKFFSAFGEYRIMVSGIVQIETSSELDRLWVKENLIDERKEYGWSTALRARKQEEHISVDLGSINRVGELRLLTKNDHDPFFPEVFRVSYSEEGIAWHHLFEENGFIAEPGTWYRWRFLSTNMRFVKISIDEGARTREGKFISQIIEIELYATPDILDESGKASAEPVPYASVLRSGIVRLARDGEIREGVVVQGSDFRLKDATTDAKGIIELATDGEDRPGVAVQGNDRRLKYATEDLPGIVRLARDAEVRAGHAVQSNDSRLKMATESEAGLVELASDGENRPGVVVQGNDRRLKYSTTSAPGIVTLAENGSDRPNEAVQGSDPRLRSATTEYQGIMRFARSGEEAQETAVQGSDPRLRHATTEASGIVELARDGEAKENVVVQGHDRRLKPATEESAGIVELSSHTGTMPGRVVQADDPRLSDSRKPLPHDHDYAAKVHDFASHTGLLRLEGSTGSEYSGIVPPPLNHSPVAGVNSGQGAGISGQGRQGVVGWGKQAGVVGFSQEKGSGILGASREGQGGWFVSEKNYALVAGAQDQKAGLFSSSLGSFVRGSSWFRDGLHLATKKDGYESCIAMYFQVESKDVIVAGDILVSTGKEGVLQKSRDASGTNVIGVAVEKASLILGPPDDVLPDETSEKSYAGSVKPAGMELVAILGVIPVRCIADKDPISPGDLLITSLQTGRAKKFSGETYRPGMIFARALGELKKGEGTVRCILCLN